jgi:hypothetical protein
MYFCPAAWEAKFLLGDAATCRLAYIEGSLLRAAVAMEAKEIQYLYRTESSHRL